MNPSLRIKRTSGQEKLPWLLLSICLLICISALSGTGLLAQSPTPTPSATPSPTAPAWADVRDAWYAGCGDQHATGLNPNSAVIWSTFSPLEASDHWLTWEPVTNPCNPDWNQYRVDENFEDDTGERHQDAYRFCLEYFAVDFLSQVQIPQSRPRYDVGSEEWRDYPGRFCPFFKYAHAKQIGLTAWDPGNELRRDEWIPYFGRQLNQEPSPFKYMATRDTFGCITLMLGAAGQPKPGQANQDNLLAT